MKIARSLLVAAGFVLAAAAVGAWAYGQLPPGAVIPAHFTADGQPNGFMSAGSGLARIPLIAALVVAILAALPRIPRYSERLSRSGGPYGVLVVGVAAVLFVTEAAIAAYALNPRFDVLRTVFLAVAVLLVVIGNFLGKFRQNHLVGIRTPWTLGDERVWDKTHRFTGWAMVCGGVVLALADLVLPSHRLLVAATVLCAAGPPLLGAAYSWRLSRREHQA
jgi:uncharacterized membrane protein